MKYSIPTTVVDLFEHKVRKHISGFGDTTVFAEVSHGWFILLEGSYEALHLGPEKPDLAIGDKVKIVIEKEIGK